LYFFAFFSRGLSQSLLWFMKPCRVATVMTSTSSVLFGRILAFK
jgi:hypothetical protein